jgi:hypothetical protein
MSTAFARELNALIRKHLGKLRHGDDLTRIFLSGRPRHCATREPSFAVPASPCRLGRDVRIDSARRPWEVEKPQ